MKQFICVSALLVLIASPGVMQTSTVAQADQHRAMLNTYCVTCHNTRLKTGGLALDGERLDRLGLQSSGQSAGDDAQGTLPADYGGGAHTCGARHALSCGDAE